MRISLFLIFFFIEISTFGQTIAPEQARHNIGETITVCGEVKGISYNDNTEGSPTFLNFGGEYPNQTFVVVVFGADLPKFDFDVRKLKNKNVCVSGVIDMYRGKPEIIATEDYQITVEASF